jgi:hypothetical protein
MTFQAGPVLAVQKVADAFLAENVALPKHKLHILCACVNRLPSPSPMSSGCLYPSFVRSAPTDPSAPTSEPVPGPPVGAENEAPIKAGIERQTAVGIQPLAFGPAEGKRFVDVACELGWQALINRSPERARSCGNWRAIDTIGAVPRCAG